MDFAILKVNGRDVSNVAHEDMVRAFELAEEPIIIEVARRGAASAERQCAAVKTTADFAAAALSSTRLLAAPPAGEAQPGDFHHQLAAAVAGASDLKAAVTPRMTSVATQTDNCDTSVATAAATSVELSAAERPVNVTSPPSPPPLTAFEWPQMLPPSPKLTVAVDRAASLLRDGGDCDPAAIAGDLGRGCEVASQSIAGDALDHEDSTDELLYLSVTLHRQQASDRVGLTLCYGPAEPCSGVTDVFVGEVEPGGIAGQDGRILEGDQLLQINGQDVLGRESAVRLFSECSTTISLLVCRAQSQWAEDDGFAEDPAEAIADYQEELASRAARLASAAAASKTTDACQGSGLRDVAPKQQPDTVATRRSGNSPCSGRQNHNLPPHTGVYNDILATEAYLSTCGEEEEEDDDDGTATVRGHEIEISEEHCRRFLQALQLKCEAIGAQLDAGSSPTSAAAQAAAGCATVCCQQQPTPPGGRPLQPRLGTGSPATQLQQQQHNITCDKRLVRRQGLASAAEDGNSSSHDTAYNTAESCRSSSFATQDAAPSAAAVAATAAATVYGFSSGTSSGEGGGSASPRLRVAERCRALRSPPTHDEARTRADGGNGFAVASDRRAAAGTAGATASRPSPRLPATRSITGGCDASGIEYTDRENLAQVMAMQQQRLLAERLAAVACADGAADSQQRRRQQQPQRAVTRGSGRSSPGRTTAGDSHASAGAAAAAAAAGSAAEGGGSSGGSAIEWVVKVRADGSRYIARRPASRSRLLKERQRRLEDERCGLTTDDDAASELKLGRRWSHAERRRHLESAREHRRRRELARLARAAAAVAAAGDGDPAATQAVSPGDLLLELSHRKLLRRQLADIDFTTVQELLVHGSRRHGVAAGLAGKALLSVTTV